MNQTKQHLRDTVSGAVSTAGSTMKSHPLPVALLGMGAAWLLTSLMLRNRTRESHGWVEESEDMFPAGYQDQKEFTGDGGGREATEKAREATEKARKAKERMRQKAREAQRGIKGAAGRTREGMSTAVHGVRRGATRTRDQVQRYSREQPLALAGIGLLVGGVLGALIPISRREEEWMGPYRDDLLHRAEEKGRHGVEKAKKAASAAAEAAKEEAREQGFSKEGLKASAEEVKERAKDVAERATGAAKQEAGLGEKTESGGRSEKGASRTT